MNMDYSLIESLKNMNLNGLNDVLSMYDIMCQYYTKLADRIEHNACLHLPDELADVNIIPGIGLFHVHGHQPSCLVRFAPSFIEGAGQEAFEGMEILWSTLNQVARSLRVSTKAARAEGMDDHINDSNWKKVTSIGNAFPLTLDRVI